MKGSNSKSISFSLIEMWPAVLMLVVGLVMFFGTGPAKPQMSSVSTEVVVTVNELVPRVEGGARIEIRCVKYPGTPISWATEIATSHMGLQCNLAEEGMQYRTECRGETVAFAFKNLDTCENWVKEWHKRFTALGRKPEPLPRGKDVKLTPL